MGVNRSQTVARRPNLRLVQLSLAALVDAAHKHAHYGRNTIGLRIAIKWAGGPVGLALSLQ